LPLTTFFPRWLFTDQAELDSYFEREMPNPRVQPLFDRARALGIGFYLGYAELTPHGKRYNTAITVGPDGSVLGKYRKIHLPGTVEPRVGDRFQQLEKRYFEYGDLGFPAFRGPDAWGRPVLGMLICNDRRWPEAWRCYGLQGIELMLIGYNSAAYDPMGGDSEDQSLRTFHSTLAVQGNAYMNATWAISVAKAGVEDGSGLIGGSVIVDPNGRVVAEAKTLGDEIIVADVDFDACRQGKEKMFNFAAHRRPQWYRAMIDQVGAVPPA
jgi:predicted amidohydrolase